MPTNPWVDAQGWADEWNDAIDAAIAESDGTPDGFDAAFKKRCLQLIVADLNWEPPLMKRLRLQKEE